MDTSQQRDEWQERIAAAEAEYEDALIEANTARIGTPAFLDAMAAVRAAREHVREINEARTG